MPKSWSLRASIATRIWSIMAGLGPWALDLRGCGPKALQPQGLRSTWAGSAIPSRPREPVASPQVACGAGEDAALTCGFARAIHFGAHAVGALLDCVEPGGAVHR